MERFEGQKATYEVTAATPVVLGRTAVFFAANDMRTGVNVLIKAFRDSPDSKEAIQSLQREIGALQRLKHPNILEIIDYNLGSGQNASPFLVVPWCRGGNLEELQSGADFLPLEAALPILRQIGSAIDYAHENGVIHGDIKPQNVLFSEDRHNAYLCDFGMSKYFSVTDQVRNSQPFGGPSGGAVGGTSAYLSPEQLSENQQSPRSDIYSFGLVAYKLLTGRMPFDIGQPLYWQLHARVTGHLKNPLKINPNLAPTVCGALTVALAVTPDDRPVSASKFCDMLVGKEPVPAARSPAKQGAARLLVGWQGLEPAGKAAVIGAIVAAAAAILVAIVQVLPKMLDRQ